MKNILMRIVTGVILAGILFLFAWLSTFSQIIFDMLILAGGIIGVVEMYKTMKKKYRPMLIPILLVAVISYPLVYFFDYTGILASFGIGILHAAIFFVFAKKKKSEQPETASAENLAEFARYSTADFGITLFIMVYPMLILDLVFIMNLQFGLLPLMLALGAALAPDLFAYTVGSIVKGPKIFPTISPKKTYSGCIGGIFGGAVGGLLIYAIFEVAKFPANTFFTFTSQFQNSQALTMLFYGLFGAFLALIAQMGDLFASRIKRELQIKDFSKLLGAHGGIMDRIDSTLMTVIPVFLVMVIAFA